MYETFPCQVLEQLKTDFLGDWLNLAISNHYEIFISTLLPFPPEFARVGGAWDRLSTTTEQLKDGLAKLLAVIPYDVVSLTTWNRVMPTWMQEIAVSVEDDDLPELKVLLWY